MFTAVPASHLGKLADGRYRLLRVVGEGASSWVFAASDERLKREVALKVFKLPSSGEDRKRNKRCIAEARTLAKLVHPHIVAVHDASQDPEGHAYLVMELCEAGTLEAELALRGRLEIAEALRLAIPLMGALAFAHDRDVVHRDIKPGNIVLVEERGERRCKLLDFGISLATGVRTGSDLALGTPAYMAPEQVRGEPCSPATDVWALGVVLFRCLTGGLPFQANSSAGVLLKVAHERAPRLSSLCTESTAPNVMRAIDRALEPNQERRYRDMRSFAHAIAVASALDKVALAQRPEPVGLPEFDAWALAARSAPTTEPLPLPTTSSATSNVGSGVARARRGRGTGLLFAALLTGLIMAGALAISDASEAEHARREGTGSAHTPNGRVENARIAATLPAERVALERAAVAPESGAQTDHAYRSSPPMLAAPSALAAPAEALEPERAPQPARQSVKRREQPAKAKRADKSATDSSPPRVIQSWDW